MKGTPLTSVFFCYTEELHEKVSRGVPINSLKRRPHAHVTLQKVLFPHNLKTKASRRARNPTALVTKLTRIYPSKERNIELEVIRRPVLSDFTKTLILFTQTVFLRSQFKETVARGLFANIPLSKLCCLLPRHAKREENSVGIVEKRQSCGRIHNITLRVNSNLIKTYSRLFHDLVRCTKRNNISTDKSACDLFKNSKNGCL